jgi:hypothetical protein
VTGLYAVKPLVLYDFVRPMCQVYCREVAMIGVSGFDEQSISRAGQHADRHGPPA